MAGGVCPECGIYFGHVERHYYEAHQWKEAVLECPECGHHECRLDTMRRHIAGRHGPADPSAPRPPRLGVADLQTEVPRFQWLGRCSVSGCEFKAANQPHLIRHQKLAHKSLWNNGIPVTRVSTSTAPVTTSTTVATCSTATTTVAASLMSVATVSTASGTVLLRPEDVTMASPARTTRRVEDRPVIECRDIRVLQGIPFFEGEDVSKREASTSVSVESRPMDVRPKTTLARPRSATTERRRSATTTKPAGLSMPKPNIKPLMATSEKPVGPVVKPVGPVEKPLGKPRAVSGHLYYDDGSWAGKVMLAACPFDGKYRLVEEKGGAFIDAMVVGPPK